MTTVGCVSLFCLDALAFVLGYWLSQSPRGKW